jgi:predicted O-linked N-acetylglucosamine transferase (SPINDLY family)
MIGFAHLLYYNRSAFFRFGLCFYNLSIDRAFVKMNQKKVSMQTNPLFIQAESLRKAAQWTEAEAAYRSSLATEPSHVAALFGLALVLQETGQWLEAEKIYLDLSLRLPQNPIVAMNLGNLYLEQGNVDAAEAQFLRALQADPQQALAWYNLGRLQQQRGALAAAEQAYRQALSLAPGLAQAANSLGTVWQTQQRFEQALSAYHRALELQPDLLAARNNLGTALLEMGLLPEAESCFRQVLAQAPDFKEAWLNLAQALRSQGQAQQALQATEQAVNLAGNSAGLSLLQALTLPPIYADQADLLNWRAHFTQSLAELENASLILKEPWQELKITPFYLAYQGLNDRELMAQWARIQRKLCPELLYTAPHCKAYRGPRAAKLRIGFASFHLREHTIATLFAGLIQHWDTRAFERIIICFAPPTGALMQQLKESVEGVLLLSDSFWQARQEIADLELDILLWLDLGMDPRSGFLAQARLAPLQAVTWGHPVTTGIANLDLFISNQVLEPPELPELLTAQRHYSEKLVLLPHLHPYYALPKPALPDRERFGLGGQTHYYLCPQSLFKIHPDLDPLWAELLRQDPQGVILLPAAPVPAWQDLLQQRFRATLPDLWQRIVFFPRQSPQDFQALLSSVDVILDSAPFGAGNTAYEALGQGQPLVTWPGDFLRGRFTQGFYRQMGLADLISTSPEAYVERALALALQPELKQVESQRIRAAQPLLFEQTQGLRELEQILLQEWEQRRQKK